MTATQPPTTAAVDLGAIEDAARQLLVAIGEDPRRPGLADTPARYARWWAEFIDHDPGTIDTVFESVHVDQMVAVSGVRVWSLCEHHLLPFWCDVTIGYITRDRVLGLSKFARIARMHGQRLQLQERLVAGIAADVGELTGSPDVAVAGTGEHLCMVARGVRTHGLMHSSCLQGRFRDDARARAEFFALTGQRRGRDG